MTAWGRMLMNAMNGFKSEAESGLVRMFRIEYAKEYRHMKQMGCDIDDNFVHTYLREIRQQNQ